MLSTLILATVLSATSLCKNVADAVLCETSSGRMAKVSSAVYDMTDARCLVNKKTDIIVCQNVKIRDTSVTVELTINLRKLESTVR